MFFYNRATMLIIALSQKASVVSPTSSQSIAYNYWLSPNGMSVSLSGQASPTLLPKNAGEVVAVIPWQLVSWHSVKLPSIGQLNDQKLNAVLSAVLEDELLDEVSALHFILPSNLRTLCATGQDVVIGACSRVWLKQATNALQKQGITVQRIVCELTPINSPFNPPLNSQQTGTNISRSAAQNSPPVLYVIGAPSNSANAVNAATAVLCTTEGVIKLPQSTTDWSAFKALAHPGLKILCEPHWVQNTSQALGREPTLHNISQRMIDATQSNWDAATGEWEQSRGLRFWRSFQRNYISLAYHARWSLARKALVCLVAINLIGLNAWSWLENAKVRDREVELSKLLKETFPAIGLIIDPSLQMQREMRKLQHARGQSAAGDLESMLGVVAAQLPPSYRLQSFTYSANELRLNGVSKDLLSPSAQDTLQRAGYAARGESTAIAGQTVPVLVITFVDNSKQ